MKVAPQKLVLPGIFIAIGIALIIIALQSGQNSEFMIGASAFILTGIIYLLQVLNVINSTLQIILTVAMLVGAGGLAMLDYKSIQDPLEFMKEKQRRDKHVVQRLKDIRTIELAYKAVNNKFSSNFDTLRAFVVTDSFRVVKAIGMVPDSLVGNEARALELGLIRRDTFMVSIQDSLFSAHSVRDRVMPFYLDSIEFLPFGGGEKFVLESGDIDRNNTKVKVFQATAPIEMIYSDFDKRYYREEKSLSVGSMTDPSTSGNWGE